MLLKTVKVLLIIALILLFSAATRVYRARDGKTIVVEMQE